MFAKSYAQYYNRFNFEKDYKKEIEFVYGWAENPKRILDVGCGTANYWKYFPEGAVIRGVERSRAMIDASEHTDKILCDDVLDIRKEWKNKVDLVTALFDVMNYIPIHNWWGKLPIKKGGYFVFDVWHKGKVDQELFKKTVRTYGDMIRIITPLEYDGKEVRLEISVECKGQVNSEIHTMYVYSHREIERLCGDDFEIVEVRQTKKWQTWYKLKRK